MKRIFVIVLILAVSINTVFAQNETKRLYPVIGETLPNHTFTDVINYPKKTVSIEEFRGKWLILDFWGYTCTACINNMPKMDSLSQKFKDRVQIIMVGCTNPGYSDPKDKGKVEKIEKITKDLYNRLEKKYHLGFTVAFDSILYMKHDVGPLPHILVIDPNGIVRAKTIHLDEKSLNGLLDGKQPLLDYSYSRHEVARYSGYKTELPLLTNGKIANGGNDTSYLFRSLLVPYTDAMIHHQIVPFDQQSKTVSTGSVELFEVDLPQLYKFAFFGVQEWDSSYEDLYSSLSNNLILNISDSTRYKTLNLKKYAYSLKVPASISNRDYLMKCVQLDLEKFFHFKAHKEIRQVPVYLVEIDNLTRVKKLFSKSNGFQQQEAGFGFIKVKNMPIDSFIRLIIDGNHIKIPVLNGTGLQRNIDVDYRGNLILSNIQEIDQNLKKYGLKLTQTTKAMEAIILNDIN